MIARRNMLSKSGWLGIIGTLCLLTGVGLGLFGLLQSQQAELSFTQVQNLPATAANFPALTSPYSISGLTQYQVRQGSNAMLTLDSVQYVDANQQQRQALIYLPNPAPMRDAKQMRHDLWRETLQTLQQHSEANALLISWWDNAQRIDFATARASWTLAPSAAAFDSKVTQNLWQQAAGPFAADDSRLRQLARWLSMDAAQAQREMAQVLPANTPIYWLLCVDDLARLAEIEKLAGKKLGFEARLFAQSADIHQQIAEVKRWASEAGTGSYLLHDLPQQGTLVWRILDTDTENTLLAKLLPFSSSIANPPPNFDLVFQSSWGAYLSIYQWHAD